MTRSVFGLMALLFAVTGVVWPLPASAQTLGYGEAMTQLVAACGADIERHCSDVRPGSGRIAACIDENAANVSDTCKATISQIYTGIAARQQAQGAALGLCERDARRVCSEYRPGNGRILRCLLLEHRQVSDACLEGLSNAGWR
ncbi:MAG: cysteine rich repeat-containing protein [Pseudomonadota bacterium]